MDSVNEESGFNRGALFKHGLRTMMNKMSELNEKTEFNQLIQKALLAAESVTGLGCVWLLLRLRVNIQTLLLVIELVWPQTDFLMNLLNFLEPEFFCLN